MIPPRLLDRRELPHDPRVGCPVDVCTALSRLQIYSLDRWYFRTSEIGGFLFNERYKGQSTLLPGLLYQEPVSFVVLAM
jgi:hypothetical protein